MAADSEDLPLATLDEQPDPLDSHHATASRLRDVQSKLDTIWSSAAVMRIRSATLSIFGHALLVLILLTLTYTTTIPPQPVTVEVELPEEPLLTEAFLDDPQVSDDSTLIGTSTSAGAGSAAIDQLSPEQVDRPTFESASQAFARTETATRTRPLQSAPGDMSLSDMVPGMVGVTLDAGGVEGSVDRITAEILRQLAHGPVLVAWLFDASQSLRDQRQAAVNRFRKVLQELQTLGKLENGAILNTVASFGEEVRFETESPSANLALLQKAAQNIKVDESGIERVFTAIRQTALQYRRYQKQDRRSMMMIVMTDETGDDPAAIDECANLVRRNRIPVYVLGPMASFARQKVTVNWRDEKSGINFRIPIDRGPESWLPESALLPYWTAESPDEALSAGFGPYGLSYLARVSGGVYFMLDDKQLEEVNAPREALDRLHPDYLSLEDYTRMLSKNPLRSAVVRVSRESSAELMPPNRLFPEGNLAEALSNSQKSAAATADLADRGIAQLRAVEKLRENEKSPRWRASYDLLLGRLLRAKVRANEYNWTLAQMRVNPLPLPEKMNAWNIVGVDRVVYGLPLGPQKNEEKKKPVKAHEEAVADAERAKTLLESVQKEYAGTPWGVKASRELAMPTGFDWKAFYIPPPPDISERPEPPPPPPPPVPPKL